MCLNLCLFASLSLPPERHGTGIRSYCDAEWVCGSFSSTAFKKKPQKHPYFTFELNSLANICGVQTLSSPHLVTNVYQTETFNSSKQAKTSEASASICTGALSCKCVGIFKQLQDMRAINTHPLLPGSVFPLLPSLSRLTNADGACINAPLHTACQTCTF